MVDRSPCCQAGTLATSTGKPSASMSRWRRLRTPAAVPRCTSTWEGGPARVTRRTRSQPENTTRLKPAAKRVILCVPPADEPDITVVMGVNDDQLTPAHRIISTASVTANCAAPLMQLVDDAFGLERLFFTTVHAYTNDQRLADVPARDLRRSRAATENITPTDTNAGRTLEQLLPHLTGRITGMALNVPVLNGSLVAMTLSP